MKFSSALVPPYVRRSKSIAVAWPWLYLKGIATGGHARSARRVGGRGRRGLSANHGRRLKAESATERRGGRSATSSANRYLYPGGPWHRHRGARRRRCPLLPAGHPSASPQRAKKELVTIGDGLRESTASWPEVLRDLKARGLDAGPLLAVGDGALGSGPRRARSAPRPGRGAAGCTRRPMSSTRCPRSLQGKAKARVHDLDGAHVGPWRISAFTRS